MNYQPILIVLLGAEKVLAKAQDFERLANELNLDFNWFYGKNHWRVTGLGSYVVRGFHQIVCQLYKAMNVFRINVLRCLVSKVITIFSRNF